MRRLFSFILILALAIGISLLAGYNHGYVVITLPTYHINLSFNLLLVLIALSFICLHIVLRLVQYIRRLPSTVRTYKEHQQLTMSYASLVEALTALAEGRYQLAEKTASKNLTKFENSALNALIAARASHKLRQKNQRDYYFAEAERISPSSKLACLLAQAEAELDDRQFSKVINTTQKIDKIQPQHPPALRLALKAQIRTNQWEQALTTIKSLEKVNEIEFWYAKEIRQQAHSAIIKRYAHDLSSLNQYWKKLTPQDQMNPVICEAAASAFISADDGNQAAEIIGMSLTKHWNKELAGLFGDCVTTNPQKQIQQAEFWLLSHNDDANLLRALGNLCLRQELWGKAQIYLEASISVEPSALAHATLAILFEHLENTEQSQQHYKLCTQLFMKTLQP
jgi:HemY protein